MCFDVDGDWCAIVNESVDGPSAEDVYCFECRNRIRRGEQCRTIHQREYELCQECQDTESPSYGGGYDDDDNEIPPKPCEGIHDYGETFDCVLCKLCVRARAAIRAYELKEGCPDYSTEPLIGRLDEVFMEHEQKWAYAETCVSTYPDLLKHPFIAALLEY